MKRNLKSIILSLLCLGLGHTVWAEDHFLVGGATASGWNAGEYARTPVAMVNVSENLWTWAGKLTVGDGDAGRFKIPNSADGWEGYWAPAQGTVLTSEWSDLSTTSTDDKKFCVAEEGYYRIYIDTKNKKIKAEKLTEPTKDGDYYQIATVDDYYWFAGKVTSEESSKAKARLTADLDFSEKGFFPLACDKFKFKGEFDGAGHTISHAVIIGSNNNVAFIRYATGGTNIHDLIIEGSFTGNAKVGGIVGFARDGGTVTLKNVINKATVQSTGSTDANAAAFVGCAIDNTVITALNCANMGAVSGQNGQCAAFAGWTATGTTFTNCWNSGDISGIDGTSQLYRNSGAVTATNCYDLTTKGSQGTKLDASLLNTADFCYKLNGSVGGATNWYLTIGTDAHPYPFAGAANHGIIYANGSLYCDGDPKPGTVLENEEKASVRDSHNFVDGFCVNAHDAKLCDEMQADYMSPDGEGNYLIGTKQQLKWFAHKVNGHKSVEASYNINGKLTADIDFSDQTVMIGGDGNAAAYRGTFDGQGHKVTLGYNTSQKNVALFRTIAIAHIKNLITDGTIQNENNSCAGGIFAGSHGASVVENCVSYVTLSRTNDGDATFGGIGAYMHDNGTIQNCGFYGSINTPSATGNGGLLGYANGGGNIAIKNCVVNATEFVYGGNSVSVARNTGNVTNTYVVNAGSATQNEALHATAAQVESGELAYKLNGDQSDINWYQLIGTDAAPLPIEKVGATVYARGSQKCDGTPKPDFTYVNEQSEPLRDAHDFGAGLAFCSSCDKEYNPSYAIDKDGEVFLVDDATELKWFAAMVNAEGGNKDARLTADIDFDGVAYYPGIGSSERNFTGTIDGQRHIITNMKMDWSREGVGLVNRAANGACVKNVTIASNCSFKGSKAVAALIGGTYGAGDIYIENCGNEAPVQSTGQNAGGIIGCRFNDNICHLTNVYNVGEITGETAGESGSFSGWMSNAVLKNCYSIASYPTSEDTHGFQQGNQFSRGNGINLTNCYDYGTGLWGQNESTWGDAFADGRKITDPDDETQMGAMFAGLYDAEGGDVWRMEYEGWAHPVLYDPAKKVLSENVPNRFSSENGVGLTLKRTTVADTWNTICLPFALNATQIASLFGADAKVAELTGATGETLNFTTVTSTEAGKAYLVMPSEAMSEKELTVDLDATAPAATTEGGYVFTGIYEPTAVVANDLFVAAGNKLTPSDGTGKLKAFRAYFHNTGSGARLTNFVIDEETTGIASIEDGLMKVQDAVYDMQGRKVSQLKKGLYIVNGKKQVVR
ncbi:SusF/SusE family outer membrane protein [Xylanibacter brevis]|uniref:SusF/SusE family outer membrane protein n=1 Tax=Xylanibacter brevis TaxID=83231 RepID=UPI0018CC001B|nr:SusF/SusE family outer membrane protein [Xylanibacter brevis]